MLAQMTSFALARQRLRHRRGHAAILERAGGVQALVLQEKLEAAAGLRGQARRGNERRVALLQRDDGRALRQPRPCERGSAPARRARRKECERGIMGNRKRVKASHD